MESTGGIPPAILNHFGSQRSTEHGLLILALGFHGKFVAHLRSLETVQMARVAMYQMYQKCIDG